MAMVESPWTDEQVAALERFQRDGLMHPFTCGGADHDGDRVLKPSRDGWSCPCCGYRQDWAHDFMLDWNPPSIEERLAKMMGGSKPA